jgi:chromosome segregation ATPase
VKEPELARILKALDEINADLQLKDRDINPKTKEIDELDRDVDSLLKRNKRRKIDEASQKLAQLDNIIGELQGDTAAAFRKLEELKDLLQDAKANQGREDPELAAKLKVIESEALRLEKELREADD